jgi:hypothetical protein
MTAAELETADQWEAEKRFVRLPAGLDDERRQTAISTELHACAGFREPCNLLTAPET